MIIIECDPSSPQFLFQNFVDASVNHANGQPYTYYIYGKAAGVCSIPGVGKKSLGMSHGTVALIIFFSLVAVYMVGGVGYNRFVKGEEVSVNLLPNFNFWREVWSLAGEGVIFLYEKITMKQQRSYTTL